MTNQHGSENYEAPKVTDHGNLTDMTAAFGKGGALDKTFPQNTPFAQLTFS